MPPLDQSTLKSIYHLRNIDAYRFKCLSGSKERLDVMLSHDWPLGIEQFGDTQSLLRKKPYFRDEVERNTLGSPPNREVLDAQLKQYFMDHNQDFCLAQQRRSPYYVRITLVELSVTAFLWVICPPYRLYLIPLKRKSKLVLVHHHIPHERHR